MKTITFKKTFVNGGSIIESLSVDATLIGAYLSGWEKNQKRNGYTIELLSVS